MQLATGIAEGQDVGESSSPGLGLGLRRHEAVVDVEEQALRLDRLVADPRRVAGDGTMAHNSVGTLTSSRSRAMVSSSSVIGVRPYRSGVLTTTMLASLLVGHRRSQRSGCLGQCAPAT